jgi:hypothetical protein
MKMKKNLTLLSLAVLATFAMPALAQEKKMFTPEDASYNNRAIYAQRPNQLKWVGDSDILMKVKGNEIISMMPGNKKEATFLTLDELNGYTKGEGVNDLTRIPQLTWINDYQAYFFALGDNGITLNKMDLKKRTINAITSVPQDAENQNICKPTLNVAYTIGYAVSFVCNFFLTSYFTFRSKATVGKGVGFGLAHLTNYLLQMVLLNLFVYLGVSQALAPVPVYLIAIPVNFLLVRFVFKHHQK